MTEKTDGKEWHGIKYYLSDTHFIYNNHYENCDTNGITLDNKTAWTLTDITWNSITPKTKKNFLQKLKQRIMGTA